MNNSPKKRINLDLLLQGIEYMGGDFGPLLLERFKQEVLPHLKLSPWAYEELSEEEFQQKAAQLRKEAPAFIWHLLHNDFPPVPKEWTPKQN